MLSQCQYIPFQRSGFIIILLVLCWQWQKTIVQFWYWLFAALPAVAWSGYTELKAYGDITALNLRTNRPGNVMPVSKARELRRAYWAASSFADNQVRCLSSSSPLFNTSGIIRIYQYFLETKTSRLGAGEALNGCSFLKNIDIH